MTRITLALVVPLLLLAGCGGNIGNVDCDEGPYQVAVRAPKVQAPEGLDDLDPLAEIPLPAASPREPWPADGPCIEQPPQIIRMN
ncbi:MAG: hypothetical protein GTO71_03255 [Woeseiaceae bacterium]|nr:hypothetical protein [Woeseiaceae bacterium]NIP20128.1 hypothetical protein [Woeseiaceae bacterium]NIS88924.1 hypothetical protein [Woeseiaceae bacterium]